MILVRTENLPVDIEHFRARMQFLAEVQHVKGWKSAEDVKLFFGEFRHKERELVGVTPTQGVFGPSSEHHYKDVDVTLSARGSWIVLVQDNRGFAGIEACDQSSQSVKSVMVQFCDGYHPGQPGFDFPPIGAAFEEFCDMVVREARAASDEAAKLQAVSGAVAEQVTPAEDEVGKVEIFYAYAREDEDLRDELEKHLRMLEREGVITNWHDRRIDPGKEWEGEIDSHLNTARVILLLISSDFINSDYCWDVEVKRAMERHEAGEARVIPIILRPVDWKSAPFGRLLALPRDAKPVTAWTNQDEAFLDVARGIRAAVMELRAEDNDSVPNHENRNP